MTVGEPVVVDVARRAELEEAVAHGFPAALGTLGRLVKIPSFSSPGFDRAPLVQSAETVAALVTELGVFDMVRIAEAGGAPAVIARRAAAPGRPTVLLYAHHDVQPTGPLDAWTTPPFEPTLVDGRLRGRGASDDKSGVVTHLAALRAYAAAGGDLGLGLALFIEAEEESGSPTFDAFLAAHRDELAADVIVVADSDNPSTSTPGITASLRGNVVVTVRIATLASPSHSGMYGGAAPDAMLAAVTLLATLWDADGAVAVAGLGQPGLASDAGTDELRALARDAELLPGVTPIGRGPVTERLWHGPSITIIGIDATNLQHASNTLAAEVRVRLSTRIPPGVTAADAADALQRHLESHTPFGAHLEITDVELGEPFAVDTSGWAAQDAAASMHEAWGVEAEYTGIGGSIPFVATLVHTYPNAQILVTGVEDPGSKAHAPDESQDLGVLRRAILTETLLLERASRRTLGA